jgi:hypothetical protein
MTVSAAPPGESARVGSEVDSNWGVPSDNFGDAVTKNTAVSITFSTMF